MFLFFHMRTETIQAKRILISLSSCYLCMKKKVPHEPDLCWNIFCPRMTFCNSAECRCYRILNICTYIGMPMHAYMHAFLFVLQVVFLYSIPSSLQIISLTFEPLVASPSYLKVLKFMCHCFAQQLPSEFYQCKYRIHIFLKNWVCSWCQVEAMIPLVDLSTTFCILAQCSRCF